jgi:ElaB/YqjD/DUF883 family membrane-anchored ribosome-binding protein
MQARTDATTTRAWESAARRARTASKDLVKLFERTAEVLEHSATLADAHAERLELKGRTASAEDERRSAARARSAAQRSRDAAGAASRRSR